MNRFSFIGGTKRGYKLLKTLIENGYIPSYAVILKEDEHESEKYSLKITKYLDEKNIPFSTGKKLTQSDYEEIKNSGSEFVIILGWRTLIDTKINSYLKYGLIASHFSLLPDYRGFAPVQWAIINGEKESGVTLFQISGVETDSGDIISQVKVPILKNENSSDVDKKMIKAASELFLKLFDDIKTDSLKFTKQNEADATYSCRRVPEDGRINWQDSSHNIYNLIRAVAYPYPGAFCFYNDQKYIINKAGIGELDSRKFTGRIPGRVIRIDKEGIEILCGSGSIKIFEWKILADGTVSNPNELVKSVTVTLK